jgi:hypothetical protein
MLLFGILPSGFFFLSGLLRHLYVRLKLRNDKSFKSLPFV